MIFAKSTNKYFQVENIMLNFVREVDSVKNLGMSTTGMV